MPNDKISKINLPDGTTYDLRDENAPYGFFVSANLSTAGWYRVIANSQAENRVLAGGLRGAVVDIKITTSMGANSMSEEHEITIFQGTHEVYFSNELSASSAQVIDKIRYTYKPSNDYGYIDIHFTANFSVNVTVYFTVSIDPVLQDTYFPDQFSAVAASPSGEIIITEYAIAPYAQAGMIINERTITTGADGYYNFSDFPRDKYTMLNIVPLLSANTYALATGSPGTTGQWVRVFNQDGTALASTSVKLRTVFIHNQ